MDDALETLEAVDAYAILRNNLRKLAAERGEWAGYPMPLQGTPLVVEPNYPNAKKLMEIGRVEADASGIPECRERNTFFSRRLHCRITIYESEGKIRWFAEPAIHHVSHLFDTLGAADAWGIEQEHNAIQLLGTMLRHRQFKQYLLTGMFMEQSPRSGVHYMFRRLRPTLAIRTGENDYSSRIIAALCMHPIAYYAGSWAGAMCPTDDVVAHLALMRGDEPMFWRRCNQHPPYVPEAGI